MTKVIVDAVNDDLPSAPPIALSHRFDLAATATLFRMTLLQLLRGRRLLVLGALFALPTVFALLARRYNPDYQPGAVEEALIFYMIPQALVPLTALIFASGMIRDEVED